MPRGDGEVPIGAKFLHTFDVHLENSYAQETRKPKAQVQSACSPRESPISPPEQKGVTSITDRLEVPATYWSNKHLEGNYSDHSVPYKRDRPLWFASLVGGTKTTENKRRKKNKERRRIQLDRQKKEKIDAHHHNTRCSAEDIRDIGSRQMVEEAQDMEDPNYQLLNAKNQRKKTPIKEEGQMRREINRGEKEQI
jgi:hypothetical protein